MTDYVKSTNFASKDSLASGNPLKIVKGTEIDTEFNNLATSISTKLDSNGGTLTGGTLTSPTISGGSISGIADLAVADGGTGASTASGARTNLGAAASGANSDITSLSALTSVPLVEASRTDVASATTVNLTTSASTTRNINITGTTTITGFTVASGLVYFVRFAGALTLTNGSGLVTQTGANISTQSGDTCILRATAANTVEVLSYVPAKNASQAGTAPVYGCRAWAKWNGTATGTNAPTAGGNVSSITRNSAGNYTVTFTTQMPSADYAISVIGSNIGGGCVWNVVSQATSNCVIQASQNDTSGGNDPTICSIQVIC